MIPDPSLHLHRDAQAVCVVDRVQLCLFDVGMSIVELIFIVTQHCQGEVNPKLLIMPVGRGCDPEGDLVMMDRLLPLALGIIYAAKNAMRNADPKFLALPQREVDRAICSFFRNDILPHFVQTQSKETQTSCLPLRVSK